MKKLSLVIAGVFVACSLRADPGYLSSETYSLTSNSASRTILITNFVTTASGSFEWYPASLLLNNRGATTGELLRVEHLRTSVTNIMEAGGLFTLTNVLVIINSASGVSTNWAPETRWYVAPSYDRLRITTVVTNGEITINREINR